MHTTYDNSSKKPLNSPKVLIPLEWVSDKLDKLHKVNENTSAESCKPTGVKALVKNLIFNVASFLFQIEGYPAIFQSDIVKEFVTQVLSSFLQENDVQIKHGKPYHPQSQGQVENLTKQVKRLLSRYLQKLTKEEQSSSSPTLNRRRYSLIRVYKQREPSSIISKIIPDDATWDEDVENDDDEDDSDGDIVGPSPPSLTETELFQICSSASLTPAALDSKEKSCVIKRSTAALNALPIRTNSSLNLLIPYCT